MKLSLLDDARTDAFHAIDSFNELAMGLGEEFEDELFACFDRIKRNPEHYAENENGFRMARLKRFQAVVSVVQVALGDNFRCPSLGKRPRKTNQRSITSMAFMVKVVRSRQYFDEGL